MTKDVDLLLTLQNRKGNYFPCLLDEFCGAEFHKKQYISALQAYIEIKSGVSFSKKDNLISMLRMLNYF